MTDTNKVIACDKKIKIYLELSGHGGHGGRIQVAGGQHFVQLRLLSATRSEEKGGGNRQ